MTDQPEALILAEKLEEAAGDYSQFDRYLGHESAAMLREQHAEIEALRYHLRTITFSAELVQNYVAQLGADCEKARKERTS